VPQPTPGRNVGTTVSSARASGAPGGARAGATLHVVYPPELRAAFPLPEDEAAMGRDPGMDGMVIDHGTVSRRHAALTFTPARRAHAVRDLGSRNGTWVDGVRAAGEARALVNGSVLRLGDTLLVYEHDPPDDLPGGDAPDAAVSPEAVPGRAASVRTLRARLARAAADPAPALIVGETGTGKERIARELHRLSGRAGRLIAVNCATLGAHIVESQLFGHVRGAFTGATEAQPGLFRAAHEGTLFLDEIGELPPALQPKLLRVLQEHEVLPVGGTQPVRVDVRVVAATHRDLGRATGDGTFREDLYARLAIWEVPVPPLRERRVDLLDWIDRLHAAWAGDRSGDGGGGALRFDADAAEALLRFAWPLNLRALDRLVHEIGGGRADGAAAGRAGGAPLALAALPAWLAAPAAAGGGGAPPLAETAGAPPRREAVPTRDEFIRAYQELDGSVHALARRFARDRRQIYRWLTTHGLPRQR
jgi:transcriptional regulator with GAF, ATPase, and Fis domain